MSGGFSITISAVDKATATIKGINKSFDEMQRPFKGLHSAVKKLSEETGLTKLGEQAAKVGERLKSVAEPMLALAGIGGLAEIARQAVEWGELGEKLNRLSIISGVSTYDLQALGGSARISGASAEAMAQSLTSLGDTMQGAIYGRAPQALMLLDKMGIKLKRTADGSIDAADGLRQVGKYFAAVKPNAQVARLITSNLGIDQSLIPWLRKGPEGAKELENFMRASGAIMPREAIERADEFGEKLTKLKLAGEGLRNTVGDKLLPVFTPAIEKMTTWVVLNREWLGTNIAAGVGRLGTDVKSVGTAINEAVTGTLGWRTTLEGLALYAGTVWVAGMLAPIARVAAAMASLIAMSPAAAGLVAGGAVGGLAAGSVMLGKKTVDKGIPWWTMIPGGSLFASDKQLLGQQDPGGESYLGHVFRDFWKDKATPQLSLGDDAGMTGGGVVIRFENAPPGMKARVIPGSNGSSPRIEQSLPGGSP